MYSIRNDWSDWRRLNLFSIDNINEMLDEIAAELPAEVFDGLNGGISLLPDVKRSPETPDGGLFTLGEYRRDQMGRYIVIYYGSLCATYPGVTRREMYKALKNVLTHELTHHMESRAGLRDLEVKDKEYLEDYFKRKGD